MSSFEMYKPEFEVVDIFKALKKIKNDELIPENGALGFFYQHSQYPGVSFFVKHKKKIKFFYIDHDDFILEVKDQVPDWDISADGSLLRIIIVFKVHNARAVINFVFDLSDKNYVNLVKVLGKNKEINLYYLTMLYGGLVLDSSVKFKIPPKIIDVLKKIK